MTATPQKKAEKIGGELVARRRQVPPVRWKTLEREYGLDQRVLSALSKHNRIVSTSLRSQAT